MRRIRLWLLAFVALGAAIAVRVLYQPQDPHERMHAEEARAQQRIDALARLPPEQQLAELRRYLSPDTPVAVRTAAVEGVARLDLPEARALLREALRDVASPVRLRVAEMATRQPREEAFQLLMTCLADHDAPLRQTAITHLQSMRDPRAVAALMDILRDDPSEQTQQMTIGALRAITNQPFHARYTDSPQKRAQVRRQWLQWYHNAQRQYPTLRLPPIHPTRTIAAPNLTLRTLDGETIDLRRPPKPLLINFWGTWCGECQMELPDFAKFHETYGARVLMVGVAFDEPEGERSLRKFCAEKGVRYPQALGTDAIARAFDIDGVPQTVLIDTQGAIRFWWQGARDFGTLERALQLLEQAP